MLSSSRNCIVLLCAPTTNSASGSEAAMGLWLVRRVTTLLNSLFWLWRWPIWTDGSSQRLLLAPGGWRLGSSVTALPPAPYLPTPGTLSPHIIQSMLILSSLSKSQLSNPPPSEAYQSLSPSISLLEPSLLQKSWCRSEETYCRTEGFWRFKEI